MTTRAVTQPVAVSDHHGGMTTLYRLFDADDRLLYVGIAGNPGRRFQQHASSKAWWGEVDHVELAHCADREAAGIAERHAIITERPRYNIVHSRVVVGSDAQVRFPCATCGQLIESGGFVEVDEADLIHKQQAHAAWRADLDLDGYAEPLVTLADLARVPEPVHWRAFHYDCGSELDQGRTTYSIDLQRLQTLRDVIRWTSHLMEKAWLDQTDWLALLAAIGGTQPADPPLTISERDASHG